MSYVAYWLDDGTPVPHTFSNVGGALTFDNFPVVAAGRQFVIELTVVLNDSPVNVSGTQFINTAKWDFGRLIEGVFYEPLPGEWGITEPMTIAAPELVVTKSGPATMNLGEWGDFVIDVENVGLADAWDVSISDLLPDGPTGGMCDVTPEVTGAQVFAADGSVSGLRFGRHLVRQLQGGWVRVRGADRAMYHAMCVFASNFVNALLDSAEEIGLMMEIGEWVLHRACTDGKRLQTMTDSPLRIAINVSNTTTQVPQRSTSCLLER